MALVCCLRKPLEGASSLAGAASLALQTKTQLIRHVTLKRYSDLNRSWTGRGLALALGASQAYIGKLTRQFEDGKLSVGSPWALLALSFEELGQALGSAKWQTRKMKEQGLLRCTYREAVAMLVRGY